MNFNVNSPILFVLSGIVVAAVLAQSIFFLIKAWRRGIKIGMDPKKLKKIAITATIFTIAPAISILIGVITLAKDLGIALPWLRLSVVGSLSYETVAANNALSGMGLELGKLTTPLNAQQFLTISIVMSLSVFVGIWLVPLIGEKYQKGLVKFEQKDKKWSDILFASLFTGMISAFIGYVFSDFGNVFKGDTSALVPVIVFFISAIIIVLAALIVKKKPTWRWINDYALPISMILGMASAIPLTAWLG